MGSPLDHAWRPLGEEESFELWALEVSDVDVGPLEQALLDAAERRRARRLRRPRDRQAFVGAHALLRHVLSRKLGCSPEEIEYGRERCSHCGGPNGRPVLVAPAGAMHFSLSHSAPIALVGVSEAPIGVDVQAVPDEEMASDVGALLHVAERAAIERSLKASRPTTFARIWARKEAYLKGLGTGIAHGLASDCVSDEAPRGWRISDLRLAERYVAAVALRA